MPPRKREDWLDDRSSLRSDLGVRARSVGEQVSTRSLAGDPLTELRDIRVPPEGVKALGLPDAPPEPPPLEPAKEKLGWFQLTIVDEKGAPIEGIDLEVTYQGTKKSLPTPGNGRVRVDGVAASFANARFVDVPALREKLRSRKIAALDEALAKAPDVRVEHVRDSMSSVSLDSQQPLTLMLVRDHVRVRLVGMFFETDKAFLLPTAMHGIRAVRKVYDRNPGAHLLCVGHTDTAGDDAWNLDLSLERAGSVADFLTDVADGWLQWFDTAKVHPKKVWGPREEQLMLSALPDAAAPFYEGEATGAVDAKAKKATAAFQAWSNETRGTALIVDGRLGPETRRQLVMAYMELDDTSLPKGMELKRHGCGEFFPEDDIGDGVHDAENRRVEVFCFDGEIDPPPPGKLSKKGSTEYPRWKKQITETIDFTTDLDALLVRLFDRFQKAMANAPCRVSWAEGQSDVAVSSSDGVVEVFVPKTIDRFVVEWGDPSDPDAAEYEFRRAAKRVVSSDDAGVAQRLVNLGLSEDDEKTNQVRIYQERRGQASTGRTDDVRDEVVAWHDDGTVPGLLT